MGFRELVFGKRNTLDNPRTMIGFPSDGGLTGGGVSASTTLGLSAVWRCIDILSNGVSQLEWRERRGTLDLPLSRIVNRPQAQRTRREWTSLVVSTLALFDVCYLLKAGGEDSEGVPLGLWYTDPTLVQPGTQDVFSTAFLLPPDEFWVGGKRVTRDDLVILHRSPQPTISDQAGGIINLARTTFAAALAAERYASRYWQAGGSPTTVLETDAALTPDQADETSQKWYEKRSRGPDYAPVLSRGLKARSFGADPTSESAVEARKELVADIGRYFGVPTRILNAPTGDSSTYSSTEASNQDLVRYTLQNYIGAIEDAISDQLPGGRRMSMNTRVLTAGTQYSQAQAYQLATANAPWMLPEEVREEIGLPPVENPSDLVRTPAAPVSVGPSERDLYLERSLAAIATREAALPPVFNLTAPVTIADGAIRVDARTDPAQITVNVPEQPVPTVTVEAPPPAAVTVTVPEQPAPVVNVNVPDPKPTKRTVERDQKGQIVSIVDG